MTGDPSNTGVSSLATSTTPSPSSIYPAEPSTRPTIILPALKDRPAAITSLLPHLRTMTERAHAGITAVPLPSSVDAPEAMAGTVIDPHPHESAGPAPLEAPAEPLPLTTHSSQTDSDLTEPGNNPSATSHNSGAFHVDSFLASIAESSNAPTLPVYPTAAPSATRSLKRQSSKALDTAGVPVENAAAKSKNRPA
ncbi:hypothetical protein B0H14DRAFT_2586377 [Mycena olivaceomarginata]|nr:hypothetical protein B0H14DRAFT_2586377 [Mycena olivaceomarginata]